MPQTIPHESKKQKTASFGNQTVKRTEATSSRIDTVIDVRFCLLYKYTQYYYKMENE